MQVDELVERFEFFDDWEERYAYLIDLGRTLEPMPASAKTEDNKVHGCMSQVWFTSRVDDSVVTFVADSDSTIVRGLIAVLLVVYGGRAASEIVETDVTDLFDRLGLGNHLTSKRRNGFASMVQRVKALAAAAA